MPAVWIPGIDDIFDIARPFGISSEVESEILTYSPAAVIAYYLINTLSNVEEPNASPTWPLYISSLPDGSNIENNAGCVYDTTGLLDGRIMRTGEVIEHHGIQIKIRAIAYQTGWQKIRETVAYLQKLLNEALSMGGSHFVILNMSRVSPIACIGTDEKRRFLFTVNFLATIREL